MPSSAICRESTVVASRWAKGVAGAGAGRSAAGGGGAWAGGEGAALRRGDRLVELAHLGAERRLVANRRRHAAEERGDLRAGLGEAEDVVDEEEDVLPLLVAEVLGDRQRGGPDAQPGPRWLRHLAVDERRLLDDPRLLHLEPEVVPFAGALPHPGEDRDAAVVLRDVVDQLHDDDGLADAGAAEEPRLPAPGVGLEEVDDLDARLQDLDRGRLILERRGRPGG